MAQYALFFIQMYGVKQIAWHPVIKELKKTMIYFRLFDFYFLLFFDFFCVLMFYIAPTLTTGCGITPGKFFEAKGE